MRRLLLSLGFAGIAACASSASTAPTQERIDAHATLSAAEQLQQYQGPRAQGHIARAREDIKKGDVAMTDEQYKVARFYFERSESASEAAIAWSHAREAEQLAGLGEEERNEPDVD